MQTERIFVFTGTSGSGRKTVARKIGEEFGLTHVISCTTRPPRNPEKPDSDYHYVGTEMFEQWERDGKFVQTATIDRHRYGVLTRELDRSLSEGRSVYLILNREGASAIKSLYGERVVRVFVYVDKQTTRERLESKGTPFDVLSAYLDHYSDEVTYRKNCEHVVENVELGRTLERLRELLRDY